ncbi:MAG: hypothetical protein M3Y26_00240 [Actinomycetota bacterium]|nr:hypothetical protein [Actinomycetota bacterium]
MRDSVRSNFIAFTSVLEGVVDHMYLDVLGLVTVAIGNLVDGSPGPAPWLPATHLPFVRRDGLLASQDDIISSWRAVKGDPKAAKFGHRYAERIRGNDVRLTEAGISEVVLAKLDANDRQLAARFPGFADWPADAQLATHSMAWACGAAFRFPRLEAHLRARDFDAAVNECHMNETGNAGLRPRNAANKTLYANAARVHAYHLDPELHWPAVLSTDLPSVTRGEREEETGSGDTIHPLSYDVVPDQDDVA